MTASTIVVTGTDTGVGKTRIACGLLRNFRALGLSAAGFKPVASGAAPTANDLRSEDGLALLEASSPGLAYASVNPYCFEPAIAPHLAAQAAGVEIETAQLDSAHARLAADHHRVVLEGAGGWLVPLNESQTFADWIAAHRWPVLLVVGVRLGCINHALLSAEAIMRRTRLAGWIANTLPPAPEAGAEMIAALRSRMPAPLLASIEAGADEDALDAHLARSAAAI